MLAPERIEELAKPFLHLGDGDTEHDTVDWVGFARVIERECAEEAARIADSFRCGSCGMDGKAAARIRQILGDPSKGVTVEVKSSLMQI